MKVNKMKEFAAYWITHKIMKNKLRKFDKVMLRICGLIDVTSGDGVFDSDQINSFMLVFWYQPQTISDEVAIAWLK